MSAVALEATVVKENGAQHGRYKKPYSYSGVAHLLCAKRLHEAQRLDF